MVVFNLGHKLLLSIFKSKTINNVVLIKINNTNYKTVKEKM